MIVANTLPYTSWCSQLDTSFSTTTAYMLLSAVNVRSRCVTCPSARNSVLSWITMAGEVDIEIAANTVATGGDTFANSKTISTRAKVSVASARLDAMSQGLRRIH